MIWLFSPRRSFAHLPSARLSESWIACDYTVEQVTILPDRFNRNQRRPSAGVRRTWLRGTRFDMHRGMLMRPGMEVDARLVALAFSVVLTACVGADSAQQLSEATKPSIACPARDFGKFLEIAQNGNRCESRSPP